MATITKPSDYQIGETKIPNAVTGNPGEGMNADVQYILDKYEKDFVIVCLGYDQYVLLQAELAKLPFTTGALETADDLWVHLVNGNGEWMGLRTILLSYVWCNWARFAEVEITTTGAGKPKVKNATVADWNQKYTERWNEVVRWTEKLRDYLTDTDGLEVGEDFPCFRFENQFGL